MAIETILEVRGSQMTFSRLLGRQIFRLQDLTVTLISSKFFMYTCRSRLGPYRTTIAICLPLEPLSARIAKRL